MKIPENRLVQASDLQQLGTIYQLNPTETRGKFCFLFLFLENTNECIWFLHVQTKSFSQILQLLE